MADSLIDLYRTRAEQYGQDEARHTQRWNAVANLRLVVFLLALGGVAWAIWYRNVLVAGVSAALWVVFLGLVRYHARLARQRARAGAFRAVNEEAISRIRRDWDSLPLRDAPPPSTEHPYAHDLDLYGTGSLIQLLDTTGTRPGYATLRTWLEAPASPDQVQLRQAAVRELAPLLEMRQELQVEGRLRGEPPDLDAFLFWAESDLWLLRRPVLLWSTRLFPLLLWCLLAAWAVGVLPFFVCVLGIVPNAILWHLTAQRRGRALQGVMSQSGVLQQYADSFALLSGKTFTSPLLVRLNDTLSAGGVAAHTSLRRLNVILRFVVPPSALLYAVLQLIFLWDAHVLVALERWQARDGRHARGWFASLGELEALTCFAALSHDHPEWVFPQLDAGASTLVARQTGHPLLPPDVRVDNDVTLGPAGTVLLVTGSNMAGKSTLLRTLGLNVVLAQAGGPVCAQAFRLPPLRLWTSMRVTDSLAQGVSFFLAELRRLKLVVDAARPVEAVDEPVLCYLLDEILQGTNSAERQIAVRRILQRLSASRAIGAISTHDLALADAPEIAAIAQPVHFQETITTQDGRPVMTFDYRLRPGVATSTNALRLVEIVGLAP